MCWFQICGDIGHCFAILPPKMRQRLLNYRVAMATNQARDEPNLHFFDALYIDPNILKVSFSYFKPF